MDEIRIRQKGFGSYFISTKPRLKCKKPAPFTGEWLIHSESLKHIMQDIGWMSHNRLSVIQTASWKWYRGQICGARPNLGTRHDRADPWIIIYESYDYFFRRRVLEWNCIISDHDQNEMHSNCIRIMLPMKNKNQGLPNNQGSPDYQGLPDDNSDVHDHTGRPGSRCWFKFRFYTPVYTLYFILMVPLNTRTFEILRRRCYRRFILVLFKSFEKIIYTKINSQKII